MAKSFNEAAAVLAAESHRPRLGRVAGTGFNEAAAVLAAESRAGDVGSGVRPCRFNEAAAVLAAERKL